MQRAFKKLLICRSRSTPPPAKRQKTSNSSWSSNNSSWSSPSPVTPVTPIFSTTRNINKVPVEVWKEHICYKFLNLTDLSILRRCHTFFDKYWQNITQQNVIRVPQGCPTLEKALVLANIFSERKEYTTDDPLKIVLAKGVHEIVGDAEKMVRVTCNHLTLVGKGNDQTTIRGGFVVENQQHVTFEKLTVSNPNGYGLCLHRSETTVDMLKCIVNECKYDGMYVLGGATVAATQCTFTKNGGHGVFCGTDTKARLQDTTMHHNEKNGLVAFSHAVVDLYGTKTAIHANKRYGLYAFHHGKINIHLPSQHETFQGNGRDRVQDGGGSIANINADGTFTHVVVDDEEDDY